MSTDPALLHALATLTQNELRYFELSQLKFVQAGAARSRRAYLAVGKHGIFLVKKDCSKLIKGGGGRESHSVLSGCPFCSLVGLGWCGDFSNGTHEAKLHVGIARKPLSMCRYLAHRVQVPNFDNVPAGHCSF